MGNRRRGKGKKKPAAAAVAAAPERSLSACTVGTRASGDESSIPAFFDQQSPIDAAASVVTLSKDVSRADDDEPQQHTISANLVVNTHAVYALTMLDTDDYATTGEFEGDLLSFAVPPPSKFNGRYEMRFMFVTPTVTVGVPGFRQAYRAGAVVINGRHRHELGPLWREATVQSAVLLDEPPTSIRFEVFTTPTPVLHPTEAILADHVLAVLSLDEYGGSVTSSHVQNQVRELPFYAAVFDGGVRPSWQAFIEAHGDKWSLVKYTKEEIEERGTGVTCRARELRLYANEHAACYVEGDIARDRIRVAAEKELHEVLLERLRERPYEQSELLKELVNERSFLTLMTLNFVKIMGMYEALPDQYFVLCDALHPITIEPRVKQLPPEHNGKGGGGGLRYDRVRRVWVAPTETAAHERSSTRPAAPAAAAGDDADADGDGDAGEDEGAARP